MCCEVYNVYRNNSMPAASQDQKGDMEEFCLRSCVISGMV